MTPMSRWTDGTWDFPCEGHSIANCFACKTSFAALLMRFERLQRDHDQMLVNLTETQERCTALLEEKHLACRSVEACVDRHLAERAIILAMLDERGHAEVARIIRDWHEDALPVGGA